MIKIKSITIKNFFACGNQTQAIKLNHGSLTLVLGENLDLGGDDLGSRNGCGKSSILNAISYGLYGQAITFIKKDNLINRINSKNMFVTIEFEKNSIGYRVERGRKPNLLRFYINDVEQEIEDLDETQGDSRKTQEEIVKIIGLTHDMFCNIVALNTEITPFLSMRAAEQRAIIEQLLGITLLSSKSEKLKEEIKKIKDKITLEKTKIDSIVKSNNHIEETITSLKLKQQKWTINQQNDVENYQNLLSKLENVNIDQEIANQKSLEEYNSIISDKKLIENKISSNEKLKKSYENQIQVLYNELLQLQNHTCHVCGQELHEQKYKELIDVTINNINEIGINLVGVENILSTNNNLLNELKSIEKPEVYYDTITDAYNHRTNWEILKSKLHEKLNEVDPYDGQITDLQSTAIQVIDGSIIDNLEKYKEHQEFILKLLTNKDSFIRKKIISQNLGFLNKHLTKYLELLGLPHQVEFLDDLSVDIKHLGLDLDFNNLSRGEKTRLILALSFSFRELWEQLYSPINLLIVDELLDNGLDASGVERAMSILKQIARDRDMNVFLISHREELCSRVNNILKVVKENSFTRFEEDFS